MTKKIFKLAVIRSNGDSPCPFGLPIPLACKKAGGAIQRMAPLDILGEDASEEEKNEIAQANKRLLMWMLSEEEEEEGGRCTFANKVFDKDVVECSFDSGAIGESGSALRGSPFYYKHFSGTGLDGLYSVPIGYYTDNSIDRGMYHGMYSIESTGQEEANDKDLDEKK